jgi:hypothetical protein
MTAVATDRRIAPRLQPAFGTVCRLGRGRPVVGLVRDGVQGGDGGPGLEPHPGQDLGGGAGRVRVVVHDQDGWRIVQRSDGSEGETRRVESIRRSGIRAGRRVGIIRPGVTVGQGPFSTDRGSPDTAAR